MMPKDIYFASVEFDSSTFGVVVVSELAAGFELFAAVAAHEVVPIFALVDFGDMVQVLLFGV